MKKDYTKHRPEVMQIIYNSTDYTKLQDYHNYTAEIYMFWYHITEHADIETQKYIVEDTPNLLDGSYCLIPIHAISISSKIEILEYAIKKHSKKILEKENSNKWRPIHYICDINNYETIKWAIQSNYFNLDTSIRNTNNLNWIDYIKKYNILRLLDENIISPRQCGYIIKYLQEEQTVEICQDAIDNDPDNKQYIRADLQRYFQ